MMVRTQVALDPEEHRRAKRRAAEQGISLAEYVRRVVHRDLGGEERPKADISEIFDLGASGQSDVSANKDRYLGESLWREHLRKTGQLDRLHEPRAGEPGDDA
jgi:plasmid stability protein